MRVWIFQTGEPLHCDLASLRPMRAMNLANSLVNRGHSVVIWSSAFFHQEKRHRSTEFSSIVINESLTINLVPSIGYNRNIGIKRLVDHAHLGLELLRRLNSSKLSTPDIAFIGFPPIETTAVAIRWLKRRGIPTVVDVKDLWPSLFLEPIPVLLKPLVRILLFPYFYFARRSLLDASAFSSMSQEYLNWISNFSGRKLTSHDTVNPLTIKKIIFTQNELHKASHWWSSMGVSDKSRNRFCFVGSFMSVFDFSSIRVAAARFQQEGIDCQFLICGDGDFSSEIRAEFSGLNNILFPGWIDSVQFSFLANCCSGALIPYKNIENFTINTPNKVIDALSHGLPIVTTLTGVVEQLVLKEAVGFACNSRTGTSMYDSLKALLFTDGLREKMSTRALNLFNNQFSYDITYNKLVDTLEVLVNHA